MRLLHVIERVGLAAGADWGALACRAFVDACEEHEHLVALAGSGADAERADRLAIGVDARVHPVPGRSICPPPGIRALERDRGPFDRVILWSHVPARDDRLFRTRATRVSIQTHPPAAPTRRRRPSPVAARAPEATPILRRHVSDRRDWRRRLRERHRIRDDEILVVLAGHADDERTGASFVFSLGLLECAAGAVVGLMPASPGRGGRAARLQRPSRLPSRIVFADEPECVSMLAADAVLVCPRSWRRGGGADGPCDVDLAALAAAATLGIPTVVPETPAARQLAEAIRISPTFVLNATVSDMARGLLRIHDEGFRIDDPIGESGVEEAARRFSDGVLRAIDAR